MAEETKQEHITAVTELWNKLRPQHYMPSASPVKNANEVHKKEMTPLDKFAVKMTEKVGSMGFFFIILGWTIIWCGYNILASEVPALHWKSFDPFPAFVAYLLMSNVIQILFMPLIMVGQNLQGRHSEIRAEMDFEINKKAEQEVLIILRNLEHNTDLIIQLMKHSNCSIAEGDLQKVVADQELGDQLASKKVITDEEA